MKYANKSFLYNSYITKLAESYSDKTKPKMSQIKISVLSPMKIYIMNQIKMSQINLECFMQVLLFFLTSG